jgi:hypothetical protein
MNHRCPCKVNDGLMIPINNHVDTISRHCPVFSNIAQYSRQTETNTYVDSFRAFLSRKRSYPAIVLRS